MGSITRAYMEGMKDGVRRFAWWKDGVQFVGTCGTTLEQAIKDIDAELGESVLE